MDLLRCVGASIRCKERVSERQIVASQLELVELDCGWGPHNRTANSRCCTDSWPPIHSDGHSLHSYIVTPHLFGTGVVELHSGFQSADPRTTTLLIKTVFLALYGGVRPWRIL